MFRSGPASLRNVERRPRGVMGGPNKLNPDDDPQIVWRTPFVDYEPHAPSAGAVQIDHVARPGKGRDQGQEAGRTSTRWQCCALHGTQFNLYGRTRWCGGVRADGHLLLLLRLSRALGHEALIKVQWNVRIGLHVLRPSLTSRERRIETGSALGHYPTRVRAISSSGSLCEPPRQVEGNARG